MFLEFWVVFARGVVPWSQEAPYSLDEHDDEWFTGRPDMIHDDETRVGTREEGVSKHCTVGKN